VTDNEILAVIADILAMQFNINSQSITRETAALDVDGWDSVNHVLVMLEVERKFGVGLRDENVFGIEKVGDLVDALGRSLRG
jgi:acyl carrier protein